ncbi:hypothetical protein CLAFUW4_07621 [Fulvia fulva]|uniref:Uncharacterized protein n=1 Tax=Passalora fulva TaxID=5499 RepID=A0A9Q8UQD3_PASFU|nr:uncharacterized protein CLAFUR5_07751 [Fulvia fulva]KAK4609038.1 hypothetical protein CLAFUR4_14788 [Fulvia fulva]KAK4621657.1 hypothetical protein CLAFUR4_07626 [Fulvia fulva]KAK4622927.1 hypothetical protein CLAFUR0_07626 [Fulvia fulva]UJO18657.1 hypothetical protein CLAFUR5_07751 [Fulvia fulva]WPV15848.1 hypothetical protein CLAFUW4_07621 [Fulvia fulva]
MARIYTAAVSPNTNATDRSPPKRRQKKRARRQDEDGDRDEDDEGSLIAALRDIVDLADNPRATLKAYRTLWQDNIKAGGRSSAIEDVPGHDTITAPLRKAFSYIYDNPDKAITAKQNRTQIRALLKETCP